MVRAQRTLAEAPGPFDLRTQEVAGPPEGPPVASGGLEPGLERWKELERRKERKEKGGGEGGMERTARTGPRQLRKCRVRALGRDPEGLGGSLRGSALILKAPASQKQVQNAGRWESSSDAS